jgi:hypothetical protein
MVILLLLMRAILIREIGFRLQFCNEVDLESWHRPVTGVMMKTVRIDREVIAACGMWHYESNQGHCQNTKP